MRATLVLFQLLPLASGQVLDLFTTNPDKNANTHEYIASRGFNWQFYSVPTNDGYFIGVYRIVHPFRPVTKQPVVCATTAGGYSKEWLRNSEGGNVSEPLNFVGPNLGFEIAKRGYDVWLMDWRGTVLDSYQHVNYTFNDIRYFDWSVDERALFDLPAVIDFVRLVTGRRRVAFMGLQEGAREYLMLASMVPRFNKVVQPVILISSVWSTFYETNPSPVQKAVTKLQMRSLISARGPFIDSIAMHNFFVSTCNLIISQRLICNPLLYLALSFVLKGRVGSTNYDRLSDYTFSVLYSYSKWQFAQQRSFSISRKLRMLDVSPEENIRRYGGRPLEYMPERITNPEMHVLASKSQLVFTYDSFRDFKRRLGAMIRSELVLPESKEWSAFSYLDGEPEDVSKLVNEPILRILDSYNR